MLNAGCWMLHKHMNFKKWGIHPDLKKKKIVYHLREKNQQNNYLGYTEIEEDENGLTILQNCF